MKRRDFIKKAGVAENMLRFEGRAIIFDSQEAACEGILAGRVESGHVVVIRYEGPRGGPGIPQFSGQGHSALDPRPVTRHVRPLACPRGQPEAVAGAD